MAEYKVRLRMVESLEVHVEANSAAEAKRKALEYAQEGGDWWPVSQTAVEAVRVD